MIGTGIEQVVSISFMPSQSGPLADLQVAAREARNMP